MKIRIKGNSVRIRLSRTETGLLATEGKLKEQTNFINGTFCYALQSKAEISELNAGYADNTITVYMPQAIAAEWADNQTVGYSNTIALPDGSSLFVLVEKDFKCIDADVSEDQSDNYENPLQAC